MYANHICKIYKHNFFKNIIRDLMLLLIKLMKQIRTNEAPLLH